MKLVVGRQHMPKVTFFLTVLNFAQVGSTIYILTTFFNRFTFTASSLPLFRGTWLVVRLIELQIKRNCFFVFFVLRGLPSGYSCLSLVKWGEGEYNGRLMYKRLVFYDVFRKWTPIWLYKRNLCKNIQCLQALVKSLFIKIVKTNVLASKQL